MKHALYQDIPYSNTHCRKMASIAKTPPLKAVRTLLQTNANCVLRATHIPRTVSLIRTLQARTSQATDRVRQVLHRDRFSVQAELLTWKMMAPRNLQTNRVKLRCRLCLTARTANNSRQNAIFNIKRRADLEINGTANPQLNQDTEQTTMMKSLVCQIGQSTEITMRISLNDRMLSTISHSPEVRQPEARQPEPHQLVGQKAKDHITSQTTTSVHTPKLPTPIRKEHTPSLSLSTACLRTDK